MNFQNPQIEIWCIDASSKAWTHLQTRDTSYDRVDALYDRVYASYGRMGRTLRMRTRIYGHLEAHTDKCTHHGRPNARVWFPVCVVFNYFEQNENDIFLDF